MTTSRFGSYKVGKNCTITCGEIKPEILKKIHITAGDNCIIVLQSILILNQLLIIHMVDDCQLFLGKDQQMAGTVRLFMHEASIIRIGDDCLWSDTNIWTSDMHSILDISSGLRTNSAQDITIGNRVWFGLDALILKGARVGDDTVVGAKSVVIKGDYQNNIVLSGFPAKEIRSGIIWSEHLSE